MSDTQELKPFFENFRPTQENICELKKILFFYNPFLKGEDWITFSNDIEDSAWEEGTFVRFFDWEIKVIHEGGVSSDHFLILRITDSEALDSYWKVPGFFQSHFGVEQHWDEAFEVKPQQKTITVWE